MAQADPTRTPDEHGGAQLVQPGPAKTGPMEIQPGQTGPLPGSVAQPGVAQTPVQPGLSAVQRRHMVDGQIRTYDVNEPALLEVLYSLPREAFLPAHLQALAYVDCPLTVGSVEKRELLVPMVLARMIQAAAAIPGQRVLDIAGGAGYTAAIFARLGTNVTALESDPELSKQATVNCARLGIHNVQTGVGPLASGWPSAAPYDIIFINGAIELRPEPIFEQLAENGRLLVVEMSAPNRPARSAKATVFVRSGSSCSSRPLFDACAALLPAFRTIPGFVF
jgi:protein-L-isoaspartate(D-aspartate) O-methyltransferase